MTELMQANRQWATRPGDERFTSLTDMLDHFRAQRAASREVVVSSRKVTAIPVGDDHKSLAIRGPSGAEYAPTHWSFGQLAQLAEAPAAYLRRLPAELAADCVNVGLGVLRSAEDMGLLLYRNGESVFRAATGPRYGRIWNADVVGGLVDRFGDGVSGAWKVPGEFGRDVPVTKANTTLFASDRDCFVFLADEKRRIEIPNRRDGKPGSLARGFFVWNSEVGSATFGLSTFLFDYVCCNRIVWGATDVKELRIRHTASAPDRFLEEVRPALEAYAESSDRSTVKAIEDARARRISDNLDAFLAERFGRGVAASMRTAHELEEGRPIETAWDAVTAATAVARSIVHQDARVDLERRAGALLNAA
jgi:hypothetical protein